MSMTHTLDCMADLVCPVCHSLFQEPLRTTCGHTFCSSCLYVLIGKARQLNRHWLHCPLCRSLVDFGCESTDPLAVFSSADDVKEQLEVLSLVDSEPLQNFSAGSAVFARSVKCSSRNCANKPVYFCLDGCGDICEDCCARHAVMIASADHSVVENSDGVHKQRHPLCKEHPKEKIQYSCSLCDDSRFMCLVCAYEHCDVHPRAAYRPWAEVKDAMETDLGELVRLLKDLIAKSQRYLGLFEKRIAEAEDELDRMKEEIRAKFQDYRSQITLVLEKMDELEIGILEKVDELHSNTWKQAELKYEDIQTFNLSNEHVLRLAEHNLDGYKINGNLQSLCQARFLARCAADSDVIDQMIDDIDEYIEQNARQFEFNPWDGPFISSIIPLNHAWIRGRLSGGSCRKWTSNPREYKFARNFHFYGYDQQPLNSPWPISTHPQTGHIYIAENTHNRVVVLDQSLNYVAKFGSDGCDAGQFQIPFGISISHNGLIAVSEYNGNRVQIFNSEYEVVSTIKIGQAKSKCCNQLAGYDGLSHPTGLCFDLDGNLYVANKGKNRIDKFNASFEFEISFAHSSLGESGIEKPEAVCLTSKNELCVVRYGGDKLKFYDTKGKYIRSVQIQKLANHVSIAEGPRDTIFVCDSYRHKILVYKYENGDLVHTIGTVGGSADGQFNYPRGITFGYNESLLVCDQLNHRIQLFSN